MPDETPQRHLVERAVAKRRDEWKPEAAELRLRIVHESISIFNAGDGANKNPASHGGVFGIGFSRSRPIARAVLKSPDGDLFSKRSRCAVS
jgi:hypothetical protein